MMNFNYSFKAIIMMFCVGLCMQFIACNKTTSTNKATLSGKVLLELESGEIQDYSGIMIGLYRVNNQSNPIDSIIAQYPSVGAAMGSGAAFDHRLEHTDYRTITDADGAFTLSNMDSGLYNIVLLKQEWSSRFIFECHINDGQNVLTDPNSEEYKDVTLLKAVTYSGSFADDIVVHPFQDLIIDADLMMLPGSSMILHPGSVVRINPDVQVSVFGTISILGTVENPIRMTSNHEFESLERIDGVREFDGFRIYSQASVSESTISYLVMGYSDTGLTIQGQSLSIINSMFSNRVSSITLLECSDTQIERCNLIGNSQLEYGSLSVVGTSGVQVHNSILFGNMIGLRASNTQDIVLNRNYFSNHTSVQLLFGSTSTIVNCMFMGEIGIENARGSIVEVLLCNFECSTGISNSSAYPGSAAPGWAYATANNCNFLCTSYGVSTTCAFDPGDPVYLDFRHNYWGSTDTSVIDGLIWDKHDESPTNYYYDRLGYINYTPIKSSVVPGAGL